MTAIGEAVDAGEVEALHLITHPSTQAPKRRSDLGQRPAHAHEPNGVESRAQIGVVATARGGCQFLCRQMANEFNLAHGAA